MTNFTLHLNQETIKLSTCSLNIEESEGTKYIFNPYFFVSVNVILSITSLSGSILILAALPKVLSLHPPSKLLFQCLSCTDLFVGLLSQALFITYLATIANKNWSLCGITEWYMEYHIPLRLKLVRYVENPRLISLPGILLLYWFSLTHP